QTSKCYTIEEPDDRHCRLLRPRRERPRGRRAAEQQYELAALHSMTSSARAMSVRGTSRPSTFAVRRLRNSSTFVVRWTGRSAGLSPLRIRPVYTPAARNVSVKLAP